MNARGRVGTFDHTSLSKHFIQSPKIHSRSEKNAFRTGFAKSHHRSIFLSLSDERLFKTVFSHLIKNVLNRRLVSRINILETARDSKEFAPLYNNLISKFTLESANQKIINKVRTLGNSKVLKVQNSNSCAEDLHLSFDIYSPSLNASSRKRKLDAYLCESRTKIHS